jgi:hypothetical protein
MKYGWRGGGKDRLKKILVFFEFSIIIFRIVV